MGCRESKSDQHSLDMRSNLYTSDASTREMRPMGYTTYASTTEVRPKVHTTKACIVSMEYKIKNNDGKKELLTLNESYPDAEKVNQLFQNTLGWD